MSQHFDIAVIGAGPGGYVAALKAAQLGANVAIVEKHYLGGACLNYGCIPSKALLASSELLHKIEHQAADLGIDVPAGVSFNWQKIQKRKDRVIRQLRGGVGALLKARKVTLFNGKAVLNGHGKYAVTDSKGKVVEFTADKSILALGSSPARIPGWPTDPDRVCTSDEALHWKELPKSVLIVGGGVIGCEFACMLEPLGVKVSVVEMMPKLLTGLDSSLADSMAASFKARGIETHLNAKVEDLKVADSGVTATVSLGGDAPGEAGKQESIVVEKVLVATGRRPNTAEVGLDSVGLTTDHGFIRVNDRMESPVKDYFVIGDANGQCLLAHAASAHGAVAAENALGHAKSFTAPIPSCIYTFPEMAGVGLTVDAAREKKIPISVGTFPIGHLGKAMAVMETDGFVKVVRHRETDEVLGVHMMGHNVTEIIASATPLLHSKISTHDAAEIVFAHPTISEAVKEAAEDALGAAIHLPPRKLLKVNVNAA